MRAVLDTNTIVSGLLWRGPPRQLLDAARETRITLYSSAALVAELAEVIARERFLPHLRTAGVSAVELVADFAQLAKLVIPAEIGPTVTGDPDDDQVLACALAAEAQMIVSGDNRVQNLKTYQSIPIVGPPRRSRGSRKRCETAANEWLAAIGAVARRDHRLR